MRGQNIKPPADEKPMAKPCAGCPFRVGAEKPGSTYNKFQDGISKAHDLFTVSAQECRRTELAPICHTSAVNLTTFEHKPAAQHRTCAGFLHREATGNFYKDGKGKR
jgi:hypothetical protein